MARMRKPYLPNGKAGRRAESCYTVLVKRYTQAAVRTLWLFLLAAVIGAASCRQAAPMPASVERTPVPTTDNPDPIQTPTATPLPTASPNAAPSPSLPAPTPTIYVAYIVQEGDTLGEIAKQFGVASQVLADVNGLEDPDWLYPGQALTIPVAPPEEIAVAESRIIGYSTDNHPIEVYRFGDGPVHIALVGGIHGGYEWNTILLAYQVMDYYAVRPSEIPASVSIYIIPSANPDGQALVTGQEGRFWPDSLPEDVIAARFNAHGVDLNRNWDCNWQPVGYFGEATVDAGSKPFSEAEVRVLHNFLLEEEIDAAVFWHSAAGEVYPGYCNASFPEAQALGRLYAGAAGYSYADLFTAYEVTGDAVDWLSRMGVPGIVVELATHTDSELAQNLAGVRAILNHLSQVGE